MKDPYIRALRIARVVDGDTLEYETIDLGWGVHFVGMDPKDRGVRLLGIDTPESNRRASSVAGKKATRYANFFLKKFDDGTDFPFVIHTRRRGKYGRPLAKVYASDGTQLSRWLVDQGVAMVSLGGKYDWNEEQLAAVAALPEPE